MNKTIIEINSMQDLTNNISKLSPETYEDINKRITDWMGYSGSTLDDDYIKRQFKFAERLLNR